MRWGIIIVGLAMLFSTSPASAQLESTTFDANALLYYTPGTLPDRNDNEEVVNAFQAMFIKNFYLKEAFGGQFVAEDSSGTGQIMNEYLLQQIAIQLAEQDAFNMREILLEGVENSGQETF